MADDGSIRLLDVATGEELRPLEGQDNRYGTAVLRVAFSPDGKVLAGPESRKNSLVLWDISSGKRLPPVEGPTRLIDYLAFSPDGSTLAGVGYDRFDPLDGVLRLWNLKKGKLVRQLLPNPLPGQPVFGADNRLLAAVAGKGISIWDSVAGREVRHADRGFYASRCFRLVFSPDGTLFTTADNAGSNGFELRLWETATCGQVCAPLGGARRDGRCRRVCSGRSMGGVGKRGRHGLGVGPPRSRPRLLPGTAPEHQCGPARLLVGSPQRRQCRDGLPGGLFPGRSSPGRSTF